MKVLAIFQFYLPYLLPRSDDWSNKNIGISYPDANVIVFPRDMNAPLFPDNPDKALSTMSFDIQNSLYLPNFNISQTMSKYCDRIQVNVTKEVDRKLCVGSDNLMEDFRSYAIKACNEFLYHCRVISKDPFIRSIEQDYRPQDGKKYLRNPSTTIWLDAENNTPLFQSNGVSSLGALRAPASQPARFTSIGQSIIADETPDVLASSLLLDAEEYLVQQKIRESVLALASSIEIMTHIFRGLYGKQDPAFYKTLELDKYSSFADKNLNKAPLHFCKQSLIVDNHEAYISVESMYRTRNNIIHEGKAYYMNEGQKIIVDIEMCHSFLNHTKFASKWLS